MLKVALVALALIACTASPRPLAAPCAPNTPCPIPMPPGESYSMLLDLVGCRPIDGLPGPLYDGDRWRLGSSATPLRCSLPLSIQLADYVLDVETYGWHVTAGAQTVTACLQMMEFMPGVLDPGHYNVGDCKTVQAFEVGGFDAWTRYTPLEDGSWLSFNEDYALSLLVHGNGAQVPSDGGSVVTGVRLHMTRE